MTDQPNPQASRRQFLECMGWAGTGAVFALSGGIARSATIEQAQALARHHRPSPVAVRPFSFVQISDTHIGFAKPANPDPIATLRETVAKIKTLAQQPDLILHTGDITHLAKPEQFDTAQALLSELAIPIRFIPGEHDLVDGTDPRAFLGRFGQGSSGDGWFSFDMNGVHFIGLVNVAHLGDQGMGTLGKDQLVWVRADLAAQAASTPIVVMSHFPLWSLYPQWGWATADAAALFAMLRRFGSVTALNGHVHQIQQHVEGRVMFHSARSTAYPQPAPGVGPGPGPLVVPAEQLRTMIGLSDISVRVGAHPIAIIDSALV